MTYHLSVRFVPIVMPNYLLIHIGRRHAEALLVSTQSRNGIRCYFIRIFIECMLITVNQYASLIPFQSTTEVFAYITEMPNTWLISPMQVMHQTRVSRSEHCGLSPDRDICGPLEGRVSKLSVSSWRSNFSMQQHLFIIRLDAFSVSCIAYDDITFV